MTCAPSEDSDQPGHPPSLIRVFAVRMKKAWVLSDPLSAQRRLWSDWADARTDLSLRWAHSHFVGFVMRVLILLQKTEARQSWDAVHIYPDSLTSLETGSVWHSSLQKSHVIKIKTQCFGFAMNANLTVDTQNASGSQINETERPRDTKGKKYLCTTKQKRTEMYLKLLFFPPQF